MGLIAENDGAGATWMAGSKGLRRKNPGEESWGQNTYWLPLTLEPVRNLLQSLIVGHEQVVLFGEVFGRGIQSFDYGLKRPEFRAFDVLVDGKYLDAEHFMRVTEEHGVERVPWLGSGPYSPEWVAELSKGKAFSGTHIREGVVVKPLVEGPNGTVCVIRRPVACCAAGGTRLDSDA